MTLLNIIHLSVVLGEQLFFTMIRNTRCSAGSGKKKKGIFWKKAMTAFFCRNYELQQVQDRTKWMWKQEHISMCYSESSGKDWISFHMEKQQHKHPVGYFCSPTKTGIFPTGYSNTEPPFEFLRQNDNISQELDVYFIQTTVPAWTVSELPPDSSFISMTQGRSLWPDLFFL